MVQPIDIAEYIHRVCEENPDSPGVAAPHDEGFHAATTGIYAAAINDTGVLAHITGKQAAEAIIEASGWDIKGSWPGHPSREKVISILKLKYPE